MADGAALLLPLVAGSVGAVYAVAFRLSAAAVFFERSSRSVRPLVVDEEELIAGNSGLYRRGRVPDRVGAAGRWDGRLLGVRPAFLVNAATYAVSAAVLLRIVTVAPAAAEAAAERRSWWARAVEGLQVVARTPLPRSWRACRRSPHCLPPPRARS